jgi:hypothetical protein
VDSKRFLHGEPTSIGGQALPFGSAAIMSTLSEMKER